MMLPLHETALSAADLGDFAGGSSSNDVAWVIIGSVIVLAFAYMVYNAVMDVSGTE